MTARLVAFALAAGLLGRAAFAAGDYPVDQFEKITQCMSDPSCQVQKEDRIAGSAAEDQSLTYRRPICIGGCMMVCTSDACWCEIDDKCNR
ncbi:MAG TPA: hypothetical protein VGB88_15080, partial [Alphaproteobacteria bacterium]